MIRNWFEPFFAGLEPIELYSPYPRAECAERMRPLVASNWSWNPLPPNPFVGFVSAVRFRIWLNIFDPAAMSRLNGGTNPYRSVFIAKLRDEGIGTRLSCRFVISASVLVGHVIGGLLLMGLFGSICFDLAVMVSERLGSFLLLILIGGLAVTNAVYLRSRAMADREQILDTLRNTLDTEIATWPAAGALSQTAS